MEKSDVYNMRAVPLMRKINIVKDGKTKSIVEENISMNEIRNMSCEPRMLIRKDDDVYFTELPINYHGTKMRWSIFYLYDELNDLEKDVIVKHMWPLTIKFPKYKESYIVTFVDKYCATVEFFKYLNKKYKLRMVYRYAYIFLTILFVRF